MKIVKKVSKLEYITCNETLLVMKYSFGMNCNKQTHIHSKTTVNKPLLLPDCQKNLTPLILTWKKALMLVRDEFQEGWVWSG